MSAIFPQATMGRSIGHKPLISPARIRVGVVCDYLEEQWASMDLVGDMLCRNLADSCDNPMSVTRLRPPMRRRLTGLLSPTDKPACNADRFINRFVDYPLWLRGKRHDCDVFHVVDHSYSQLLHVLPPQRTVVTCHDLDTFRCLLEPDAEERPWWFRAMTRRILNGFQQAAHVLAVSAFTRDELLRYRVFPPDRISVVRNGVHPSCSPLPDTAADAEAARLLPDGSNDRIWLLNVGSTLPRKRLDLLLRVFAAIHKQVPEARLVRIGGGLTPAHFRLATELKIADAILILPFLERDILAAIYRRGALLLHTAEAEGFGLPVTEAMACGCPVVASDVPVLREVGGAAATYCPIGEIDVWRDTVVRLLCERAQQGNGWQLRQRDALAHAARFNWAENASQTVQVYREVLGRLNHSV